MCLRNIEYNTKHQTKKTTLSLINTYNKLLLLFNETSATCMTTSVGARSSPFHTSPKFPCPSFSPNERVDFSISQLSFVSLLRSKTGAMAGQGLPSRQHRPSVESTKGKEEPNNI